MSSRVDESVSATTVVSTTLTIQGEKGPQAIPLEWHAPGHLPKALVALQHGFTRQCGHLRGLAQSLAAHGYLTLCVQRSGLTTADDWVQPLARWMADVGSQDPWGRALPSHVVVAGHSAGALLSLRLGAAWVRGEVPSTQSPHKNLNGRVLAGAVLLDPVASRLWVNDLLAVSSQGKRPVRAIMAQTSPCNARLSAWPGLLALRQDLMSRGHLGDVGIQLTVRSTHMDAEGPTSDALARWACGGHDPTPENFQALTHWTLRWLDEMLLAAGQGATRTSAANTQTEPAPQPPASAASPHAAAWRPIE